MASEGSTHISPSTYDCFLDICLTASIENTDIYILGQKCLFHSGIKPFLCDWIKKKKKEIRVCCFNCFNYIVCLRNNGGIENRILIYCNRADLPDNYAIPFTDNYIYDTESDSIAEFEEVDGLY